MIDLREGEKIEDEQTCDGNRMTCRGGKIGHDLQTQHDMTRN